MYIVKTKMSFNNLIKLNVTLSNIIFLILSMNVQSLMGIMEAKSSNRYFSNYNGDSNNDNDLLQPSSSFPNYRYPEKSYGGVLCKTPSAPLYGMYRCNSNNKVKQCTATCTNHLAFKNGLKEITIKCDYNTNVWEPLSVFPDCEQNSIPQFDYKKNSPSSGIRKSPALRTDSSNNYDNFHQMNYNPSNQHPKYSENRFNPSRSDQFLVDCPPFFLPLNAIKRCIVERNERTCVIDCLPNYEFPNGKTQHIVKCNTRTGTWGPVGLLQNCIDVSQRFCDYPPSPSNGVINCTDSYMKRTCQISCFAGYVFPDKSRQKVTNCNKINGIWSPYLDIKSCEPMKITQTSMPIQFNNIKKGALLSSGLRNSPAKSSDSRNELCKNPSPPKNGHFQCKSSKEVKLCSAECLDNFSFKYGFVEISIKCDLKTGQWDPEPDFPDCEPTCRPGCLNGGRCMKRNSCLCPAGYRGGRCEHRIASKSLKSSLNQVYQQKNRGK